jgi:hypothetical protein
MNASRTILAVWKALATVGLASLLPLSSVGCGSGSHDEATGVHEQPLLPVDIPDASADRICVDNVSCFVGEHWDKTLCRCVR